MLMLVINYEVAIALIFGYAIKSGGGRFFWGISTLLTNAYVVYKKVNELEGVNPKHLLTHYEYRKDIALYWINPQHSRYDAVSPATAITNSKRGRSASTSTRSLPRRKRPRLLFTSSNSAVSTLTTQTTLTTGTTSTSVTVSDALLDVNGQLAD